MKQIIILLSVLLFTLNLSAQNYDSYLQKAYSALEEGKIEVAQSSYNIYKKMTGKFDLDFETLIKDADVNAWKKSCYIIKFNDTLSLAVQHVDKHQIPVSYYVAETKAKASRLGNFTDWRLPSVSELKIILPNLICEEELYYWAISSYLSLSPERGKLIFEGKIITEVTMYRAVNSITYEEMVTFTETKDKNKITEVRGDKSVCHNYIIVRKFNHQR